MIKPLADSVLILLFAGMICSCEEGYTAKNAAPIQPTSAPLSVPVSVPVAPEKVNITFSSDPPAVDIWMDGVFVGVSPKIVSVLKSDQEVKLEFKKDGYITAEHKITPDQNRPVVVKLKVSSQNAKKKR
jgi:hypothetical protein